MFACQCLVLKRAGAETLKKAKRADYQCLMVGFNNLGEHQSNEADVHRCTGLPGQVLQEQAGPLLLRDPPSKGSHGYITVMIIKHHTLRCKCVQWTGWKQLILLCKQCWAAQTEQ